MFFECQKVKEQCKEHKKRMNDSLLQKFWKNNFTPFNSSNLIFSSFLVCFEWLKTRWMCQLGLYKASLYFKSKDATMKFFKLVILICLNSPITKHWAPLHQTPHDFSIPLLNQAIFVTLEALGGGLQMFSELHRSRGKLCKESTFFEFLSVRSPAYLPKRASL
jgi:hypothetical protein